jgi:Na+-transporting methylmalonyl-CoA/oxaloacetate decarboxylase gamma subunit
MTTRNIVLGLLFVLVIVTIAVVVFVLMGGQTPEETPTPTTDPNTVLTAAAQTADARLTEIAAITPTPIPFTATPNLAETNQAQTETAPTVTATSPPEGTATSTPEPTVSLADRAQYVADVTIPDGTQMEPGENFTKTWRLKNAGTSTWTNAYSFVYISGDLMGDTTSVPIVDDVAPDETVDLSVDMVAPLESGTYRSYWKMLNSAGEFFDEAVYVEIVVVGDGTPSATDTPPSSEEIVTDLSITVDEPNYSGACPHILNFSVSFTVNEATTLTYSLEAGADDPDYQFNLPGDQTSEFGVGSYTLNFPLEFSASVNGWMQFHIKSPVDMTSDQVTFTLNCE